MFFGRVFDNPSKVFDEAMLRPESQDRAAFVDGVKNITEAQRRVAEHYLNDRSIEHCSPPLQALLMIMATGSYEGKTAHDPAIRAMFTREALLASAWYRQRLETKQQRDADLWRRHAEYLNTFLARRSHAEVAARMDLAARARYAEEQLALASDPGYVETLIGTLGAHPFAAPAS
jgi:hypothetical protein